MWTISDFPAYAMLSGWSTAGRTACPYCKEDSDAFTLTKGRKQSWFDNHRKFLPPNHAFRRNKTAFRKNRTITKTCPATCSGDEILEQIEHLGLKRVMDLADMKLTIELLSIKVGGSEAFFGIYPTGEQISLDTISMLCT